MLNQDTHAISLTVVYGHAKNCNNRWKWTLYSNLTKSLHSTDLILKEHGSECWKPHCFKFFHCFEFLVVTIVVSIRLSNTCFCKIWPIELIWVINSEHYPSQLILQIVKCSISCKNHLNSTLSGRAKQSHFSSRNTIQNYNIPTVMEKSRKWHRRLRGDNRTLSWSIWNMHPPISTPQL